MLILIGCVGFAGLVVEPLEFDTFAGEDSFGYSPASVPLSDDKVLIDEIGLVLHKFVVDCHPTVGKDSSNSLEIFHR